MKATAGRIVKETAFTFYWLLELFEPTRTVEGCAVDGNSLGLYVQALAHPEPAIRTKEAYSAQRFTKEEAKALAQHLSETDGVWRATEHGFMGD